MAEQRESSGLVSLAALRRHEVERSQKQAEEARAQAEAEQRARRAAERDRERDAQQRALEERRLVHSAEAVRHAPMADLEAARAAEFDRAEREAQGRRELELRLAEERSEQRRAELLRVARASRGRLFNALSGAMCVLTWLGTSAFYLGVVRPDAERSRTALETALLDARRARGDAAASNTRANQRESWLVDRVSTLEQTLRAERAVASHALVGAVVKHERPGAYVVTHVAQGPCQENGDPLDPCLGRAPRRSPQ